VVLRDRAGAEPRSNEFPSTYTSKVHKVSPDRFDHPVTVGRTGQEGCAFRAKVAASRSRWQMIWRVRI
jgi:hypothetical protein